MKRSRGVKLLVGFLILFAAWILWSAHPFFISPKLRYRVPVPPDAKRLIEDWFFCNELGKPFPYSNHVFSYLLTHPYEARGYDYDVTGSDDAFRVIRFDDVEFRIVRNGGKWEQVLIPRRTY